MVAAKYLITPQPQKIQIIRYLENDGTAGNSLTHPHTLIGKTASENIEFFYFDFVISVVRLFLSGGGQIVVSH